MGVVIMEKELETIEKLSRDVMNAAVSLEINQVRFIVDMYYSMQHFRIRAQSQAKALNEGNEPNELLTWFFDQNRAIENEIKKILRYYSNSHPVGQWMNRQMGIGPIISAGLLAHIDITKAPTVGHIYSFAGVSPHSKWNKGEKRPWNAKLKNIVWKIGQSFVKVSNKEEAIYGRIYKERKLEEIQRNEAGINREAALAQASKVGKGTEAYKYYSQGLFPPAHVQARAERFAAKMFLSHVHEVWYEYHYEKPAPEPYPIAHLGHAHKFERPK